MQTTLKQNIIGFKHLANGMVAVLLITAGSKVNFTAPNNSDYPKCRADSAIVLEIISKKNPVKNVMKGKSNWNLEFLYVVNRTVVPQFKFDTTNSACDSGIHFYRTVDDLSKFDAGGSSYAAPYISKALQERLKRMVVSELLDTSRLKKHPLQISVLKDSND